MKYPLFFNVQVFNKLFITCLLGFLFFANIQSIEAASTINYQGTLKSSSQTAVPDTTYTFIFKLYTQSIGGSAVWTETQSLTTSNGVFSANLGSVSAFPSNLFSLNPTLYLGITVNSDSEMTPRQMVGASPYALVANDIMPTDATTTRSNLGLAYASSNDVVTNTRIAAWGDSLTAAAYPARLAILSGYSIYNGGVSGETSTQIKTRMLAATDKYSWPTIIWVGRNNVNDPTTIKADIASMVSALGHNRYLILGVLNSSSEPSGNGNYNTIIQLNNDLAALYPNNYIDIRSYLVSQYNPGVPQDVTDHNNDVVPSSLRYDPVHLTTAGYQLVAQRINQSISTLKPTTASLLTSANITNLLSDRISLDLSTGGKVRIGGTQGLYVPDQTNFTGSFVVGSGGGNLSHATGQEGYFNTFVGLTSGNLNTTGAFNTAVGYNFYTNSTGYGNTAMGYLALAANTSGYNNFSGGSNSLSSNTTGYQNVATGFSALNANTTGANNVSIGSNSLTYNATGSQNTVIGVDAARGVSSTSNISQNTILGYRAGYLLQTGASNNVLLGFQSGDNLTTGAKNIIIGHDIDAPNATASNQLNIGNILFGTGLTGTGSTIAGSIGIGTNAPSSKLEVATDALGVTQTTSSGLALTNNTAAANNAQQISPALRFSGKGWGSTASTSQSVDFRQYVVPVQGTVPTGYLAWDTSIAGDAYSTPGMVLTSDGKLGVGTTTPEFRFTAQNDAGVAGAFIRSNNVTAIANGASSTILLRNTNTTNNNASAIGFSTLDTNGLSVTSSQIVGLHTNHTAGVYTGELAFYTATPNLPTEKMRITSSGNVGIGNTGPSYLLQVGSSTPVGIVARFQNSTGTCDINPTSTALSCSSDETLKENIVSISESSLDKLKQLNPVMYSWKNDGSHTQQTGFIAQQVRNIFPNLVSEDKDTHLLSLNYMGLIPYMIKSIQEIATEITQLKENLLNKVITKELCISDTAGGQTCITKSQLDTLLNNVQQTPQTPVIPQDHPSEPEPANEETETPEEITVPELSQDETPDQPTPENPETPEESDN